jgi:hypothetical protein
MWRSVSFVAPVALDPNDASTRHQFARYLLYTGRSEEALDEIRRAKALDPYSAYISSWLCYAHLLAGAVDSARAEGRWAVEIDSTSTTALSFTAFIHLATGTNSAALAMVDRLPQGLPWLGTIAYVHAPPAIAPAHCGSFESSSNNGRARGSGKRRLPWGASASVTRRAPSTRSTVRPTRAKYGPPSGQSAIRSSPRSV